MLNKLLSQSTAVRTSLTTEIKEKILNLKPDLDSVTEYSTNIIDWLQPIIDLSSYYVYPMNGITEGLNWWYNREPRSVIINQGDYQWITPTNRNKEKILYISCPSAINGNYIEIPKNLPVALDLAYVGSADIKKIDISSNVEYVFYSFSKTFGVRNLRTGWLFTKNKDEKLDNLIHGAKYYNYFANQVSEEIIKNFPIDYIYKKFVLQQKKLCEDLSILPSDVVWLATSKDKIFDKFERIPNLNRLCLAKLFEI